jgi:F-type H+-transporting ATPase subunit epsilon
MKVELLSPSRVLFAVDSSRSILVPAHLGYMEVLKDHAPMIAEIDTGRVTIVMEDGKDVHFFVSGGYIHILNNSVKILVDLGEPAALIDIKRAEAAMGRAKERLSIQDVKIDIARAMYARKRAEARVEVAKLVSGIH